MLEQCCFTFHYRFNLYLKLKLAALWWIKAARVVPLELIMLHDVTSAKQIVFPAVSTCSKDSNSLVASPLPTSPYYSLFVFIHLFFLFS